MKAAQAFRTISEVADELDVPKHVLRFWEMRFPQIKPMKRGGGRRYYRPADVELLKGIRHLLHAEGYTIKGVQKILRDQGLEEVQQCWQRATPARGTSETVVIRPPGRDVKSRPRLVEVERGHVTPGERLRVMRQIIAELEASRDRLASMVHTEPPAAEPRTAKAPSKTARARGGR
jgi:DNA-binding transcriptional MerR regulator